MTAVERAKAPVPIETSTVAAEMAAIGRAARAAARQLANATTAAKDKALLAALILLLMAGVMLSFAASPPVAERIGLSPWYFIIRQAIFAALAVPVMLGASMLPHRAARWVALGIPAFVALVIVFWLMVVKPV